MSGPERSPSRSNGRDAAGAQSIDLDWRPAWLSAQALWGVQLHDPELVATPHPPSFAWFSFPPQITIHVPALRKADAVAELPDRQRTIVELAHIHGLTHDEVATRTGLPLGTVKSDLRRSMRKLASSLTLLGEGGSR